MRGRLILDYVMKAICVGIGGLGCMLIAVIIIYICLKGITAIDIEFLTTESRDFGSAGGILYQFIGTIWMILTAGMLSLPVAIGTAVFITEFLGNDRKVIAKQFLFLLNGIPSIVFGIFGFILFCQVLGFGISWFSGVLILALMILPTITVPIAEALESVPTYLRESGIGIGFNHWDMVRKILLPECRQGIITGVLLGLTRTVGETAPIMFTATVFSGVLIPASFYEPITTLQTHLLVLIQESVDQKARDNAWGTALVLMAIVLSMNMLSLIARRYIQRKTSW